MTTCAECRYYTTAEPTDEVGICRRYPPTPFMFMSTDSDELETYSTFPIVSGKDEACGEFDAKNCQECSNNRF